MSILFINSSPNPHGNTAKVAAALLEGKEYETLNLAEYKIYGYGQQFPDDQFFEVIDISLTVHMDLLSRVSLAEGICTLSYRVRLLRNGCLRHANIRFPDLPESVALTTRAW